MTKLSMPGPLPAPAELLPVADLPPIGLCWLLNFDDHEMP